MMRLLICNIILLAFSVTSERVYCAASTHDVRKSGNILRQIERARQKKNALQQRADALLHDRLKEKRDGESGHREGESKLALELKKVSHRTPDGIVKRPSKAAHRFPDHIVSRTLNASEDEKEAYDNQEVPEAPLGLWEGFLGWWNLGAEQQRNNFESPVFHEDTHRFSTLAIMQILSDQVANAKVQEFLMPQSLKQCSKQEEVEATQEEEDHSARADEKLSVQEGCKLLTTASMWKPGQLLPQAPYFQRQVSEELVNEKIRAMLSQAASFPRSCIEIVIKIHKHLLTRTNRLNMRHEFLSEALEKKENDSAELFIRGEHIKSAYTMTEEFEELFAYPSDYEEEIQEAVNVCVKADFLEIVSGDALEKLKNFIQECLVRDEKRKKLWERVADKQAAARDIERTVLDLAATHFPKNRLERMRQVAQALKDLPDRDADHMEQSLQDAVSECTQHVIRGTEESRAHEIIVCAEKHPRFPMGRLAKMQQLIASLQHVEIEGVMDGKIIKDIEQERCQGMIEGDRVFAQEFEAAEQERLKREKAIYAMALGAAFMS